MQFYVYEHWRLDKDECFYVGKGCGSRAYVRSHRNMHWKNIVSKLERNGHAYEIRFVATGLTEQEAFDLEKQRISFWKDRSDLANYTNGGEGASGRIATEKTRNKIKLAKKNISDETRLKMSKNAKNRSEEHKRKLSLSNTGKNRSKESKEKMSIAAMGNKSHFGKSMSADARKKISNANKGRIAWNKGIHASEEARAKMSASKIGNKNRLGGKNYLLNQIPHNEER